MKGSLKKKGGAKEPVDEPPPIEDEESKEEEPEEAQAPLEDLPSEPEIKQAEAKGDIFVTLAVYSKKYKELSAKQFKAGAVEARGLVDLGGMIFAPGEVYMLRKTLETEKLMREGYFFKMSGSFAPRRVK